MTDKTRVVVIGGGYAGVMAANRIAGASKTPTDVTMINPRGSFVERIRLHQLAIGNDDAVEDYARVLNANVRRVVDTAERIDAAARTVALASGTTVSYDYLVYAVGSTGAVPAGVPGAAEFAYPLSELEQAQKLGARLADLPLHAPVVVVGGGLTAIEAASEFADTGRAVTLVGALGPSLSGPGRRSVAKQLRKLGVTVVEALVTSVTADAVVVGDQTIPSAVTIWTAGFGVPGLAAASGLTTDEVGRLVTDETLTSVDDPHIVAAGDAATPSRVPYRMSCQAGLPMGAFAANTVLARIAGEEPADVSVPFSAQCISIGRHHGTLQFQRKDDTATKAYIGGRAGAFIKEQVCRYTVKWLAGEAAKPGSYTSFAGPDRSAAVAAVEARVR